MISQPKAIVHNRQMLSISQFTQISCPAFPKISRAIVSRVSFKTGCWKHFLALQSTLPGSLLFLVEEEVPATSHAATSQILSAEHVG